MLTYYTATTLDGWIADPDDSLEWLFRQEQGDAGELGFDAFMARVGALVMGSTTYEWVLEHENGSWPFTLPTWVMTHRELPAAGGDVRFTSGDVRTVHAEMIAAAGDRELWLVGGGDLAGQFAEAGLLDEVVVSIAPVTLGAGRPLLPRRLDLELVEAAVNGSFVSARYRVAGPLLEDRPR
ncbi:dihydrofolate reductase family protein [Blastococcus sp. BMG 814]|uniref:Dihydrofolate reductase family protein n=1 Tax=Blastococcus carthaginiensis TaxID=3050034 RepID=A0ABT9IEK9_9ACTN|nr:dihydrofolate reductase family protein [Blastococcus carthaginiensis]MDP5184026.1 dihydrofolate reductase family protein [Blastococcus carthaginiensis]